MSVYFTRIAIGVQMSLEMLSKRFWSIATQVQPSCQLLQNTAHNSSLSVFVCFCAYKCVLMFCLPWGWQGTYLQKNSEPNKNKNMLINGPNNVPIKLLKCQNVNVRMYFSYILHYKQMMLIRKSQQGYANTLYCKFDRMGLICSNILWREVKTDTVVLALSLLTLAQAFVWCLSCKQKIKKCWGRFGWVQGPLRKTGRGGDIAPYRVSWEDTRYVFLIFLATHGISAEHFSLFSDGTSPMCPSCLLLW